MLRAAPPRGAGPAGPLARTAETPTRREIETRMPLFTRLGNAMLHRLAPETSAAAYSPCTSGCPDYYYWDSKCVGATLYVSCCRLGPGCTPWYNCGPQCA
ncbi:hypothetical protein GCM10010299_03010 [Streptomyces tanashiensis]|nr:hypothetical protein GCM10010299_03010 [Streptomyces tanashiensis]